MYDSRAWRATVLQPAWSPTRTMSSIVVRLSAGGQTPARKPPTPEKMEEARERFERGLQLFDEKNFEAARVELERAYDIAPTWKLLYKTC